MRYSHYYALLYKVACDRLCWCLIASFVVPFFLPDYGEWQILAQARGGVILFLGPDVFEFPLKGYTDTSELYCQD